MLPGELRGGMRQRCLPPVNPFFFGKEWGQDELNQSWDELNQSCSTAKTISHWLWEGAGPASLFLTHGARAVCAFPGHRVLALPLLNGLFHLSSVSETSVPRLSSGRAMLFVWPRS